MLDYLERLRNKPEAERKKSVFVISFSLTAIIALIWIGSLVVRNKVDIASVDGSGVSRSIPSVKDTFAGFFDTIKNIFDNSAVFENTETPATNQVTENFMPVSTGEEVVETVVETESVDAPIIEPETSVSETLE